MLRLSSFVPAIQMGTDPDLHVAVVVDDLKAKPPRALPSLVHVHGENRELHPI
jgi:hypothetical protein